ncbi:MAG: DUF4286 family protein [Bacteroidota bacterium]
MIIYNVTINIEDDAHHQWVDWMKATHIPQVMAIGLFTEYRFSKLLTRQPDETGTTYVIQYLCSNMKDYDLYQAEHAPALQQETQKHFGGKFVAFRTIMESVE